MLDSEERPFPTGFRAPPPALGEQAQVLPNYDHTWPTG